MANQEQTTAEKFSSGIAPVMNRKPLAHFKYVNCLEIVILKKMVERDLETLSNLCPGFHQSQMESLSTFLYMFFKFSKTLAQIQINLSNNFARTSLKTNIDFESQ